eukprot:1540514-Karenia_brevis.AAC.1
MSRYNELHVDSKVVVYTDGASRGNQYQSLRYAGVGAYWGDDHPSNVSEALIGESQTNNRAELTALIRVLELEVRPAEVRTDSSYVRDGMQQYFANRHKETWRKKRSTVCNHDLWTRVYRLMDARTVGTFCVTKVKGHASYDDLSAGRVLAIDKQGNDAADALAVAGASINPKATGRIALARQLTVTTNVQKMMVDIFMLRESKRQAQQAESAGMDASTDSNEDDDDDYDS